MKLARNNDAYAIVLILAAFFLRLVGITNAPLEINHSWRQALTNMIARNFLKEEASFFFPTIDMAGNLSGIIGSEMPLFNALIALTSLVFGFEHWYGRLINLMVSSIGLWYFYGLIKALRNSQLAFYSLCLLTFSIWFTFSRKIMPDTFSIALMVIALYQCYHYLRSGYKWSLIGYTLLSSLAVLVKLPAIGWLSVLIVLFWTTHPLRRKIWVVVGAGLAALLAYLWYFEWVPYLVETYHYQLFFPKTIRQGVDELLPLLPDLAERFYFSAFYSYVATVLVLAGLAIGLKGAKKPWLLTGVAVAIIYGIFIVKTGAVFPTHNYYIIPLVPFMAFLGGVALVKIKRSWAMTIVGLFVVEAIANQQHDFFIKDGQHYKLKLETLANDWVPSDDLIVINGGDSPQQIYFTNRKGWTVPTERLSASLIDSLKLKGAEKLIYNKRTGGNPKYRYPTLYEDGDFAIYQLD